jgi:predicted phage terminase large subunit-like protein
LFATSVGGALSGRGGGYLILDDAIKDSNTAASAKIREKLWGWFQSTFVTRVLKSTSRMVIIGTRWHPDDHFSRLIDPNNDYYKASEAKHWRVLNLPALAEDNDPLGRAPGEALWPNRFPVEYLTQLRNADPNSFEALYQGRPTPVTGVMVQSSWVKTYTTMAKMPKPDELRWFMSVDFAASTASTADFSVVIVAGVDEYSRIWVHPQSFVGKVTSDVMVDNIMRLIAQFKPHALFGEKGVLARSIGPFLRKRMVEEQTFCSVIDMPVTSDKVARAQSIVARMAQGLVYYPGMTDWWAEANRQLLTFPRGNHDDFVDGMSLLGMGLTMMAPASKPGLIGKPGEGIPEVGSLGWVKWSAEKEKRSRLLPASQGW